jgi:hypothetical protein
VTEGIDYVRIRYYELADLLNRWGYTVVPDPDDEGWAEIVSASPFSGRVEMRGVRGAGAQKLSFKITEVWEEGDLGEDAATVREGASLVLYHYHGQCAQGAMRWCLFPAGHPDIPYHLHPFGNPEGKPVRTDPTDPETALGLFEGEFYINVIGADQDEEDE